MIFSTESACSEKMEAQRIPVYIDTSETTRMGTLRINETISVDEYLEGELA